jgi:phosphate-selective porin OprO/OprP
MRSLRRSVNRLAIVLGMVACHSVSWADTAPLPAGDFPTSAPAVPTAAPGCTSGSEFKVYWKDGLRMDTCDEAFRLRLGGRVFWDATIWNADDDIEAAVGDDLRNGTRFRAARLYFSGELYRHFVFKAEYDFANDTGTDFKDVYVGLQDILVDGSEILLGNAKVPFSLEEVTSSRFITFMERGLPNVFVAGREAGLHVSVPWLDKRLLTAFSVTQTADDSQFTHSGNDFNVTTRVVGVPYAAGDTRVLHLGLAYGYQLFEDNEARYRQRPEVRQSPRFVDTGVFDADSAHTLGAEAAVVVGPFSAQAEYMRAFLDSSAADDPEFSGFYVFASWFLTGESRCYKEGEGKFDRVKVRRNFLADGGGSGAWELAVRYSSLDIDDEGAAGGELDDVTAGINWYLNPNMRLMLNYVFADLDNVGESDAFMLRTQVDF